MRFNISSTKNNSSVSPFFKITSSIRYLLHNKKQSIMNNLMTIICLSLCAVSSITAQEDSASDITVVITNFDNNQGKAYRALYNSEESFLKKGFESTFTKIENNSCSITFRDVPNGIYAISMFHDENDNNKMDTALFGIPKEDYGCSNNAKGFMGPPKWQDAKFQINNKSITQHIQL